MYKKGQKVVYGIHGVCCILDLEVKTVDRQKVEYYVLEPLEQPGARFYIPTQKPAAVAKLNPLLTRQELDELLQAQQSNKAAWVPEENLRKQRYRELIGSGDRAALIGMVGALHAHRQEQLSQGRKFHLCDENFLRDAEKLLSSEFSLVLGIPMEEVSAYIQSALQ